MSTEVEDRERLIEQHAVSQAIDELGDAVSFVALIERAEQIKAELLRGGE